MPELQPPESSAAIARTFRGYQEMLARMDPDQLRSELSRINALLETQSRTALSELVRSGPSVTLSDYLQSLDRLVVRSIEPERPSSSSPRGRAAQASQTSRPLSPLDLLAGTSRLGPRLAAKLAAASVRASGRRDRG
jgi:hypothetical protein